MSDSVDTFLPREDGPVRRVLCGPLLRGNGTGSALHHRRGSEGMCGDTVLPCYGMSPRGGHDQAGQDTVGSAPNALWEESQGLDVCQRPMIHGRR